MLRSCKERIPSPLKGEGKGGGEMPVSPSHDYAFNESQ